MKNQTLHPNTKTLLKAWERMNAVPASGDAGPTTSEHPDLIEGLFVIERNSDGVWAFRNAGSRVSKLLGRELAEHNYLDFWTGHDRAMLTAFLESVFQARLPGILQARGETLTGQRIDIEMMLAPLTQSAGSGAPMRLLGLYQTLGGAGLLQGRPVWRHRLTAVFPPDAASEPVGLKLVANNN